MAITLRRQLNDDEKEQILEQYGRNCFATGHHIPENEPLHFDHVRAFAEGGASELHNIAPMCEMHNKAKGRLPLEDFRVRFRGDPDREARDLSVRLEKLERRRSKLIDPGADEIIGREELCAKLAEADEERDSLRRALREAAGRGDELKRLRNEREVLTGRFSAIRGMGLRHLRPEERRTAYDALRLTAHVDEKGDVRITGVFDADLTDLLPTSWAVAKAGAREYDPSTNVQLPIPHKGVVSAGRPHRAT